ncbi:MAG: GntR family transcriptional regulator [Geminicoccaceae bacterium]|nr:GntR family transcriptional regulator [Geminicoccaceae bacterium]
MKPIEPQPSRGEQVYQAIVDEICTGGLLPGTHLVQDQLAERLGVSRQPVQQAMALLKADGLVEDAGRRGLRVASLDLARMRQHYDIRAVLDGLAARRAAGQSVAAGTVRSALRAAGEDLVRCGRAAIERGAIPEQIRLDEAFHKLIYDHSGNPLLSRTAEPHWRFLRRAMGDVLRRAAPPASIWDQHAAILEAIVCGEAERAEALAIDHVERAATRLERARKAGEAASSQEEPISCPTR